MRQCIRPVRPHSVPLGNAFKLSHKGPAACRPARPSRQNNENLNRLATKLESGLIFAHVRAAYPGMPVSEQNCHPFQWGRYMFM